MKIIYGPFCLLLVLFMTMPGYGKDVNPGKNQKKYDSALMVSPVSVMQKARQETRQKKSLFLVDIRHEKEFNRFKIPGSINVPLPFIKAKSFLKSRPVVLIHRSIGYSKIIPRVHELNSNGFQIKILRGGLAAWRHKGGDIVGDPFSQKELNRITAHTFFMEKDHEEWILIHTGSKPSKEEKKIFANMIFAADTKRTVPDLVQSIFTAPENLKKQISIPSITPLTGIIIFNDTGSNYGAVEKKINPAHSHRVFYLDGGIQAYHTLVDSQALANRPQTERTKETGHCDPCKETAPHKEKTIKPAIPSGTNKTGKNPS